MKKLIYVYIIISKKRENCVQKKNKERKYTVNKFLDTSPCIQRCGALFSHIQRSSLISLISLINETLVPFFFPIFNSLSLAQKCTKIRSAYNQPSSIELYI
jgi:hypothetical protein